MALSWEDVVTLAMRLPGTELSTSYRQPALKVKGKLFARLREEGNAISIAASFDERDALMAADPEAFFITDHYRNYEWVLVRLERVPLPVLEELLTAARRRALPARLRRELEAAGKSALGRG